MPEAAGSVQIGVGHALRTWFHWESMSGRFMDRLLAETKVEERFTEHDLRAKWASDAGSLEHARALLAHADQRTTERVYRRRPERVKPLR
jgi:integrase